MALDKIPASIPDGLELLTEGGTIDLQLEIGGQAFRLLRCDVEESLSACGVVRALVQTFEDVDFEPLLEEDAVVTVTIAGLEVRRFSRRLGRASFTGLQDDSLQYALELYPTFWFARLDKNTRKFRDKTTEEIVSIVLNASGVRHEWRNQRACASRPYCVQYRETNFDFVSRLLEFEGIYYRFEPDGTMVLADTSQAEPEVDGNPVFELREAEGAMNHGKLGITSFTKTARVSSGASTVNDYNFKTPSTSLLSSKSADIDADLEIYDYPTGFRDPGTGALLAQLRLEALTAEKRVVEGTSTVPWFMPARRFSFVHWEAVDFSGEYLLVRLEHRFVSSHAGDGQGSYENHFTAIPSGVPFRPQLGSPRPTIDGNHTVMVRGPEGEEIHTDGFGRAKVQFHWDREAKGTDEDSRWIRVMQETSSSMVLARVGWEMVASYIDGDPDRPVAIARNINGHMMPTYAQPAHKNMMTIKTETYPGKLGFNELRMDDSLGAMRMDFHAQKDLANVVENDKTETILNHHTELVKAGVDRIVEKNQIVEIGGNETKDVQASYGETIKRNRVETIGGSESVKVKTSTALNVIGNDTETVGSVRLTIAGLGMPSIPSPKDIASNVVPHTLGALAQDISPGLAGGAVAGLLQGGSLSDVAKTAGEGLAEAALEGAMSGDMAGALKGAVGIPSAMPDVGAKLKEMVSPENLIAKGKEMVMGALFKGMILRDTRQVYTRMIGGAQVAVAGGSITNTSNWLFTELVGGVKATLAAQGSIMQSASKFLIHNVGGLVMRKSKEDMSISSKRSVVTVGATTTMHSDEKVELRGKVIEIEGQSGVTLKSGDLTISLGPDKATITGNLRAKSGDKIKISGNPDKLTA
jgi:type VI secretion system secreted protein VgrG